MLTVLPKQTTLNDLTTVQAINPTDKLIITVDGNIVLVPWGDITVTAEQTDFSTTIESISAAQVINTSDINTLSAAFYSEQPANDSVYSTVNELSSGWNSLATVLLVQQGFISNTQGNYTGSITPLTAPLVVGFNGTYANNKLVNINNTQNYITSNVTTGALLFASGTYKISGNLLSRSQNTDKISQYILAFYSTLPSVNNDPTYSVNNTPVAQLYSSVSYNNVTNTHNINGYVYISAASYGLLLFANNDVITATNTGAGTNQSLSLFGSIPGRGGVVEITYISSDNVLNVTLANKATIGIIQN